MFNRIRCNTCGALSNGRICPTCEGKVISSMASNLRKEVDLYTQTKQNGRFETPNNNYMQRSTNIDNATMIHLPAITVFDPSANISPIDNRISYSNPSLAVNVSGSINPTIHFNPTINQNHVFSGASLSGNSSTSTYRLPNANRTCNSTYSCADLPPNKKPNHVVLDMEDKSSNVVVIDGITFKRCNYKGCTTMNPINNNKLSCSNVKCQRNRR